MTSSILKIFKNNYQTIVNFLIHSYFFLIEILYVELNSFRNFD